MAKNKIGKVLLCSALIGSAVAGGMALYRKYKASSDDFDDDFLDFDDDDFDDEDFDDFNSSYEDFDDDEEENEEEVKNEDAAAEDTGDSSSDDGTKSKSYVSIPLDDNFIDGIDNMPDESEE